MNAQTSDPAGARAPTSERFEHFARFEADSLYSLFRRALGDAHAARDLLQDTLTEAWRHRDRFDSSRSFRAWVFRIGQNRLKNLFRRRQLESSAWRPLSSEPESEDPGPEARGVEAERLAAIEAAVAALPERQRWAVLLRYQEGLSCREIGDILKATPNAVSILLFEARKALGQSLKGQVE